MLNGHTNRGQLYHHGGMMLVYTLMPSCIAAPAHVLYEEGALATAYNRSRAVPQACG